MKKFTPPKRNLFNSKELSIVSKLLRENIKTGNNFRYNDHYSRQYENHFCKFIGSKYSQVTNSGSSAIFSIIGSLNLKQGSEVIVPCITDVGVVMAIIFWQLIPVACDVSQNSYNISIKEIKKVITNKTKAVIVAHIGGEPADIMPIKKFLKEKKIWLIEDCSQAHGATIKEKKVGTFGDVSFFSTMASKHHCTGGTGGIISTNKKNISSLLSAYVDRGKLFDNKGIYLNDNIYASLNNTQDEISSAIGIVQLEKLKNNIKKLNKITSLLNLFLKDSRLFSAPKIIKGGCPVHWFYRVSINLDLTNFKKKDVCSYLLEMGIPIHMNYDYNPFVKSWVGSSQLKNFYKYKIKKFQKKDFQNYYSSIDNNFNINIRESFDKSHIKHILDILKSAENKFINEI